MSTLPTTQTRFFHDTGYLRLPGLLDPDFTAELREFVAAQAAVETDKSASGPSASTKLYGLFGRDPELISRLVTHPGLVAALTSLLGPNVVFVTNRHNHATVNDPEGTRQESRLHRDTLYPTRGLVTAVVYLEAATVDNGCTLVVPGSHNLPFVGVTQPGGGGTWMDEHEVYGGLLDQAVPVPVPVPEGGVLLFNGTLFHSVGLNRTDRTRMSVTLGFRSADELDYYPDHGRQIYVAGAPIYRGNDRH